MKPEEFPRKYTETDVSDVTRTRDFLLKYAASSYGHVSIESILESDDLQLRRINVASALSLVHDGLLEIDQNDPLKLGISESGQEYLNSHPSHT